jgi:dimethylaniline monooxygenase (N-oxide forming)
MAFIGRAATFSNSLTSHLASVWLIHLLKGKFQPPDRETMLEEIEAIKRWKRGFMPAISSRSTVIKLHMVHYHDELLQDVGINPYRKKTGFWNGSVITGPPIIVRFYLELTMLRDILFGGDFLST